MEIIVKKDGELLEYLINNLDMSRKKIKNYLTHGSIVINGSVVKQYNYLVKAGMKIIIDTKGSNKNKFLFPILFEDDNIIVINKPSGLLTIATETEKINTLYHMVREYLITKDRRAKVFVVHRLDKDTSGVVIFAKNEKIKRDLQDNWNDYVKLREYVLVAHGSLKNKKDRVINYLKETKTRLVYNSKDGIEAITNYEVIKEKNGFSLVSVFLETGRRNQIRVCFKELGNPIVGDKVYGIKDNKIRLFLHANRLKLYYPIIKKEILFESNVPSDFKKLLK